jgi:hypothetical protein
VHAAADEGEKEPRRDRSDGARERGRARRRDRRPGVLLPLPEAMRERMELRRAGWVERLLSGPPDDDDEDEGAAED